MSTIQLLSKAIGQKSNFSPYTRDFFEFVNKKGEQVVYKVFRDAENRIARTSLTNKTTGFNKKRNYSYQNYTYKTGETVPYTTISTVNSDGFHSREIISTVKEGEKLDVTKSQVSFSAPLENGNVLENSFIARFSKGKKPVGVFTDIERNQQCDILSKNVRVQQPDNKAGKIITDLFYHTTPYSDISFKNEIIRVLKSELGLQDYGIKVMPAHYGYNKGKVNTFARYNHNKKTVYINVDIPKVNTRKQFVSEVTHELVHAWQHREVELLEQGLLSGARKEAAQVYKNEFSNYISPSNTNKAQNAAYKNQVVETKARELQKFVEQYFDRNMKNIYNSYVQGIIPPQIGITGPLPTGAVKKFLA